MTREQKRIYSRQWRARNPDKVARSRNKYRSKNREKCLEYSREYARRTRKENPDGWKAYHLKSKYGLTPEEKEAMILAQDQKCAICKIILDDPHIDHIEEPFKLRGVLCHNCNVSLGLMKDNPEFLRAAADYLEKYA